MSVGVYEDKTYWIIFPDLQIMMEHKQKYVIAW